MCCCFKNREKIFLASDWPVDLENGIKSSTLNQQHAENKADLESVSAVAQLPSDSPQMWTVCCQSNTNIVFLVHSMVAFGPGTPVYIYASNIQVTQAVATDHYHLPTIPLLLVSPSVTDFHVAFLEAASYCVEWKRFSFDCVALLITSVWCLHTQNPFFFATNTIFFIPLTLTPNFWFV